LNEAIFIKKNKKGGAGMEQWLPLISEVGFPITIVLYLLYRIEGKLDMLNQSILELPRRMKEETYQRSSYQERERTQSL
jgi:hypothetical protein